MSNRMTQSEAWRCLGFNVSILIRRAHQLQKDHGFGDKNSYFLKENSFLLIKNSYSLI